MAKGGSTDRPAEARPGRSDAISGAGVLLGIGLGGFVDGILLHQLLQGHHMVSNTSSHPVTTVQGLKDNTLGDGLFHALCLLATTLGLVLLWRVPQRSSRPASSCQLCGWVITGWGLFNVVEGIIDHELLRLHHVREDVAQPVAYDVAFLIIGALLIGVGLRVARPRRRSRSRGGVRLRDQSPG
jgi:uncharacterized membrane protein